MTQDRLGTNRPTDQTLECEVKGDKSSKNMDSKVGLQLPLKADIKLPEMGFQQFSKSYPELDAKVK